MTHKSCLHEEGKDILSNYMSCVLRQNNKRKKFYNRGPWSRSDNTVLEEINQLSFVGFIMSNIF
jgi:hypothetical protein